MNLRKGQGIILLVVIAAVAIANGVSSSETYNGNLANLLISESDLPEGYVAGVVNDTAP